MIIFSSVRFDSVRFLLKKKVTKSKKFKKTKPKPVETDWFRFGFFGQQPVQTSLARFFQFGLFLARFFADLARVFFGLGSVWFGFLGFRLLKPKLNRLVFSKF